MTQTTVHSYFQQILRDWVENGRFPDTTVEACAPSLAMKLGLPQDKVTFDNFIHSSQTADWCLRPLDYGNTLKGTLYLYLPTKWSEFQKIENATQVTDGKFIRQTIYLLDKADWQKNLPDFFQQGDVSGFVYYLISAPAFHQWICCVEEPTRVWLFAFYTAEDKVLITKADASDQASLELQLTSLINSNPWYGFVRTN
ncbi:MAG: hypothetical protein KGS72_03670 [Cyanobacteria bacterium REEB67]|jgi:hypothetical protein|nr:hypothetical protein [Cyanobacteria bacterium REEB67]